MHVLTRLRTALSNALGTALAWLLIGGVSAVFWLAFVVILPLVMIRTFLQHRAPGIFGNPGGIDPEDAAAFDDIWEDLVAGNLDALEAHARRVPEFPHGVDTFVERHWLTNAVDAGSVASVGWVLDQGVDPNYEDDEGFSPLMSAIDPVNPASAEVVALLLRRGADPNFKVNLDRTALHTAACYGTPDVVRLLLDAGADPLAYDSDYVPARPVDDARRQKRHAIAALIEARMREA